jgi:hypothetical protein
MIYFDNTSLQLTPSYHTQHLFGNHSGDRYVSSQLTVDGLPTTDDSLLLRMASSVVRDSKTGATYLKLVNALPSTLKITLEGITLPATVKCQQFTGAIDDQKAKTVEIETSEPTTLPPYSLRVIEL